MGRRMELTLRGRYFETRTGARSHLRRMRNRWRGKGPITGPDHDFLLEVFEHHPSALQKAPTGVSHFEVRRAPVVEDHPWAWCFFVVDLNGTATDFSARKALNGVYQNQPKKGGLS